MCKTAARMGGSCYFLAIFGLRKKVNHSATKHTGRAAKKSTAECCLMNMVERQMIATNTHTRAYHHQAALFSRIQVEPIPKE